MVHIEINNQNTVATQHCVHGGALNTTALRKEARHSQICTNKHQQTKHLQHGAPECACLSTGIWFCMAFLLPRQHGGNGRVLLAFYHFLVEKRDLTSLSEWKSHTVMLIVCVWWWQSNKFVFVLRIIIYLFIYLFHFRYLMFKSREGSAPADPTSWAVLARIPSNYVQMSVISIEILWDYVTSWEYHGGVKLSLYQPLACSTYLILFAKGV